MAMTPIERSLCNSLRKKFDPMVSSANNSQNRFDNLVSQFKSDLRTSAFSSESALNNAVSNLKNQVDDIVPGDSLEDMNNLKSFLNSCSFLDDFGPVSSLLGSTLGLFDQIDDFIDDLSLSVKELGLAKIADKIIRLLSYPNSPNGNGISDNLKKADRLINCISSLCGESQYQSWVITASNTIDDLYDKYHIVGDPLSSNYGQFNFDEIYSDVGLTSLQKNNMGIAITGVSGIKNDSLTKITNSVNKVKSLKKIGGFF